MAEQTVMPSGDWRPESGWGFQLKDTLGRLSGGEQPIADALGAGRELGRDFFGFGSLGRVNEAPSWGADPYINNQGETLARMRSESFQGGQRPGEATSSLNRLNNIAGQAGQFSPEVSQLRNQYMGSTSYARPGEIQGGLDMMRSQAMGAGARDPNTQALINQRMSMAATGMSPEQETAIRESGTASLNQGLNTALRGLRNTYSGATGPAAMKAALPLTNQYQDARANLERGIIQDKMGYQNQALTGAENLVRGAGNDEFSRQFQANTGYMGALQPQTQFEFGAGRQGLNDAGQFISGTDQNRFGNMLGAGSAYENALFGRNQYENADRQGRLNNYAGFQNQIANQTLGRQMFNLDQLANEKAGQLGLLFGSGSFGAANQATQEGMDVAREGINAMR